MADLRVRLLDLATRIATEFKTIRTEITNGLAGKQATLVSGTNIKTINSQSLLGSGDIALLSNPWVKYTQAIAPSTGTQINLNVDNSTGFVYLNLVNTGTYANVEYNLITNTANINTKFIIVAGTGNTQSTIIYIDGQPFSDLKGLNGIFYLGVTASVPGAANYMEGNKDTNGRRFLIATDSHTYLIRNISNMMESTSIGTFGSIADADEFFARPGAASNVIQKLTWSFLKTRILLIPLTGWAIGSNAAITAADTITGAFGKLQAQINALANETIASIGTILTNATAKTTLVDADTMPLNDSAASNALKKITIANLKAYILTIPLVGWVIGANSAVAATDTISGAIGKLQAQVNAKANTSHTHVASDITDFNTAALAAVSTGAPALLDTLDELAAALGDDPNFATTMTTALGNRVRYDAAQTLTAPQKTQACTNIGIGEPDTDFVATFNTGLL